MSVAEIRKRFAEMPGIMGLPSPKAPVIHSDTNNPKPPAQLPASASQNRNEVTQNSSKHILPSESVLPTTKSGKQPVPLPVFSNRNELDKTYSNSLSVSLDAVLPSKCMFFEFENFPSDYQRRDPRTIICSKQKPTMPQVITNEIHNLQRYSNT